MTISFPEFVAERFGGVLYRGAHLPNGKACLHEALNVYQGKDWSDDTGGTLDLRQLNDGPWSSDEARTTHMLPLGAIVLAWPTWSPKRRREWTQRVAEGVIREIVPPALRRAAEVIPEKAPALLAAATRCEIEGSRAAARAAARAAHAARAVLAAEAAVEAAEAARSAGAAVEAAEAARSAGAAESDEPLRILCRLMVEA